MFEKILERLEERKSRYEDLASEDNFNGDYEGERKYTAKAETCEELAKIVQEVAKEYDTCYKDCSECEAYNKEKHHCPKFCKVIAETVKEIESDGGWIPYTTNGEFPNNGQRVWLSFTTPYTSYVKSAWWIYDHFEWGNCKKVKDYPLAWKPYEVPAPYKRGE